MVKEMTLPFSFKTDRKMRFGILKRHATSDKDMQMFEADRAMMLWHTANAWEEGDTIRLLVCGMSDVSFFLFRLQWTCILPSAVSAAIWLCSCLYVQLYVQG